MFAMALALILNPHVVVIIHDYVNDDMIVRVWQDVGMEQSSAEVEAEAAPPAVRTVDTVDALKAMADPTRLAILVALMKTRNDLRVMSVKELAAELGEPQTKLYRHMRQLEAAGLIKVASTRMVSGILEQRYQACQEDLIFGRGFLREHADESEALAETMLDHYFEGLREAFRADRQPGADVPAGESYRKPVLFMSDVKVSPAKAADLVDKLEEIINDFREAEDPAGISLNLLIGCFVPADPAGH
jgi:DNA-binding transcriptional ArsR family regulator